MFRSSWTSLEPRLLDSVEYPTDREQLLERAHDIDAPDSVLDALRRLPPESFQSRSDLLAAVEGLTSD